MQIDLSKISCSGHASNQLEEKICDVIENIESYFINAHVARDEDRLISVVKVQIRQTNSALLSRRVCRPEHQNSARAKPEQVQHSNKKNI